MKLIITLIFSLLAFTVFASNNKKGNKQKNSTTVVTKNVALYKTIVTADKKIIYKETVVKEHDKAVITNTDGTKTVYEPIFEARKIKISRS